MKNRGHTAINIVYMFIEYANNRSYSFIVTIK